MNTAAFIIYLGLLQVAVHGLSDVCGMNGVVVGVLGVVVLLHHAWTDGMGRTEKLHLTSCFHLILHRFSILYMLKIHLATSTLEHKGKERDFPAAVIRIGKLTWTVFFPSDRLTWLTKKAVQFDNVQLEVLHEAVDVEEVAHQGHQAVTWSNESKGLDFSGGTLR